MADHYERKMGKGIRSSAHHCFGDLTLEGRRMPVQTVLGAVLHSVDGDMVRALYPDVTDEQIRDAIIYARRILGEHSARIADTTVKRCAAQGCEWCGQTVEDEGGEDE